MARKKHINNFNPKMLVPDYRENFDASRKSATELSERILELKGKYPGVNFSYSPPGQIVGYDMNKLEEIRRRIEERRRSELGIDIVR